MDVTQIDAMQDFKHKTQRKDLTVAISTKFDSFNQCPVTQPILALLCPVSRFSYHRLNPLFKSWLGS